MQIVVYLDLGIFIRVLWIYFFILKYDLCQEPYFNFLVFLVFLGEISSVQTSPLNYQITKK